MNEFFKLLKSINITYFHEQFMGYHYFFLGNNVKIKVDKNIVYVHILNRTYALPLNKNSMNYLKEIIISA